jgi:hypothetical protein
MPRKQRFKPSRKPKVVQKATDTQDADVVIGDRQSPRDHGGEPRPADRVNDEARAVVWSAPPQDDSRGV